MRQGDSHDRQAWKHSAAWASGCSGSLYSSGACKPPVPFLISFRRKQWFLVGSKAANTGDRPSVLTRGQPPNPPACSCLPYLSWLPHRPRQGCLSRYCRAALLGPNVWPAIDIRNQPGAGPKDASFRLYRHRCQLHRCLNLRRCGLTDLGAKGGYSSHSGLRVSVGKEDMLRYLEMQNSLNSSGPSDSSHLGGVANLCSSLKAPKYPLLALKVPKVSQGREGRLVP